MNIIYREEGYTNEGKCKWVNMTMQAPFTLDMIDFDNIEIDEGVCIWLPIKRTNGGEKLYSTTDYLAEQIAGKTDFAFHDSDKTVLKVYVNFWNKDFTPALQVEVAPPVWTKDDVNNPGKTWYTISEDAYYASLDYYNGVSLEESMDTFRIEFEPDELKEFMWELFKINDELRDKEREELYKQLGLIKTKTA